MDNRNEVNILKDIIRRPYAFPGGYEKALITTDGGVLCHKCAKEEYSNILHSTRGDYHDGWQVDGAIVIDYTSEDGELVCDHCSSVLNEEEA